MANVPDPDPGPSSGLIRSFSDDLQEKTPGDSLGRGLAAKVAIDRHRESDPRHQWNTLLQDAQEMASNVPSDEDAVLLEQSRRLYAAWNKFQAALPKEQRQELRPDEKPDIKYLIASVTKASMTWKEDRGKKTSGKLKQTFSNICSTCTDHSKLFSVIPSNDKYICLLTGSLSTIAQASINHQEIANAVAESLDELSQNIQFWNRQMSVYGDVHVMWRYIRELYVIVFEFLTEIFTQWSKSGVKRFLTSFDENALKKLFGEKRTRIQAIETRMEREANLDFQRKMSARIQSMADEQQKLLQMVGTDMEYQRTLLGASLQRFLEQQTRFLEYQMPLPVPQSQQLLQTDTSEDLQGASPKLLSMTPPPVSPLRVTMEQQLPELSKDFSRETILAGLTTYLTRLEQHTRGLIDLTSRANHLQIDSQVQRRLLAWIKNPKSDKLWIQGPHDVQIPSQNTLTAISLVSLSRKNEIPCIFYFGTLGHAESSEPSRKAALKDFLTLLIVQLVLLLPEQVTPSVDLSPTHFAFLNEESFDTSLALGLIRDLRSATPPMLHCIFDDIQILEDRSDQARTLDLLSTIGTLCTLDAENKPADETFGGDRLDPGAADVATKLCFTTDGYVDVLGQAAAMELIDKTEFRLESTEHMADNVASFSE